ncbi:MAG: flagellar filament capping protein FliD [Roseburia sp.]|nr:flagellar filament capping protein FliD [Roseburia sp.]
MSDLMRMTGMYSGMDTEAVIQSLVSAKAQKVTNLKNDQKKLEWTQNIWQDLNKKIYNLYSKTLSDMRFQGSYGKKKTKISDPTKATVTASGNAVNGVQTLKIENVAKAGYLTGAELQKDGKKAEWALSDKMENFGVTGTTFKVTVGEGDEAKETEIKIEDDMTISQFVGKLQEAGVNASFDETNQRFFISATDTGTEKEFKLEADNANALKSLGLDTDNGAKRIAAQNAKIVLNDAVFESSTNNFSINGLTIDVAGVTDENEELTITTSTDTDGIYNMIKDFISEYNEIINEVYQKYNADSARKYSMLTDEQKESMSDEKIEKWEDTIKGSLLRKDSTLQSIMSSLTGVVNSAYEVNGKQMWLFDFGIETLGYFEAEEGERHALHIAGDADDEAVSGKDDKLRAAIASDPDGTIDFFTSLCKNMYDTLGQAMKGTEYSSVYKVYEDKRMKTEYDDYTKKIKEAEKKLSAYEDKWYNKFSAMEVALSKLQSNQNTITSMLGL